MGLCEQCHSRSIARERGHMHYMSVCKYGHLSRFYVINGGCLICQAARQAVRRENNPELFNERTRQWRLENPELAAASNKKSTKKWKAANPELYDAIMRKARAKWRRENPELAKEVDTEKQRKWRASEEGRAYTKTYWWKRKEKIAGRPRPKVCEIPGCENTHRISFDHDHSTGAFRGWICMNCNLILGQARDNADLLLRLADYLKKS